MDGQIFLDEDDDVYCVWRGEFDEKTNICTYWMDLFQRRGNTWDRSYEEHREYAYTAQQLTAYLKEHDVEHNINEIAWPTIGVMLLCVSGMILCLKYSASVATCTMPILTGALGTWFYLATPVMHLGTGWWLHALLFMLLLITGLYGMVGNRKVE